MNSNTQDTRVLPFSSESERSDAQIDGLEALERMELDRRTQLLQDRDNISASVARKHAMEWLASETGKNQLRPLIDTHTYRIHYLRKNRKGNHYFQVNAQLEGRLYDWISTHEQLAELIRKQYDAMCDKVVTLYALNAPDVGAESEDSPGVNDDDRANAIRIKELEDELEKLRDGVGGEQS